MTCLFCDIAQKKIPAKLIFEDDHILAFEDIHPQAPTHVLIIPKTHIENLNAVDTDDAEILAYLLLTAKKLANTHGLTESGYRLVLNTGSDGGQTVYHLHLHLLGGRAMHWPPG